MNFSEGLMLLRPIWDNLLSDVQMLYSYSKKLPLTGFLNGHLLQVSYYFDKSLQNGLAFHNYNMICLHFVNFDLDPFCLVLSIRYY
jgi:hypothetical protein